MSVIRNKKVSFFFFFFLKEKFLKQTTTTTPPSAVQERKNAFGCKELRAVSIIFFDGSLP